MHLVIAGSVNTRELSLEASVIVKEVAVGLVAFKEPVGGCRVKRALRDSKVAGPPSHVADVSNPSAAQSLGGGLRPLLSVFPRQPPYQPQLLCHP